MLATEISSPWTNLRLILSDHVRFLGGVVYEMATVRVAIVGAGHRGLRKGLKYFVPSAGYTIVAVCDTNEETRQRPGITTRDPMLRNITRAPGRQQD